MQNITSDSQHPSNDNEAVVNEFYLEWLRNISQGQFKAYLRLGRSYESGNGVNKDVPKALKTYEKYYEAYRSLVPARFNLIEFLIGIGNKYKSLGNNYRAAEWYLKASMHIIEEYNSEKKQQKVFNKYRLEELIKETGCHNIV